MCFMLAQLSALVFSAGDRQRVAATAVWQNAAVSTDAELAMHGVVAASAFTASPFTLYADACTAVGGQAVDAARSFAGVLGGAVSRVVGADEAHDGGWGRDVVYR
jgi:hypothetical protein